MKEIALASLGFFVLFLGIEAFTRRTNLSHEISRKLAHILGGIGAAALPFFMTFNDIAILSGLFIAVMLISKNKHIFRSIHDIKRSTYGEVYFPASICLTALLFPDRPLYIFGVLVMAISDALASIVGQALGRRQYQLFRHKKSYAGSIAFAISTFVLCYTLGSHYFHSSTSHLLLSSAYAAIALAAVEACTSLGLDNLLIPPLAALVLSLLSNMN